MPQTYKQYRPTPNDTAGLGCDDRQDWLVCPVIRTRDSGTLEESNFAVVLSDLGGESDTLEVKRFNHWGPGWFEIVLAHPSRLAEVEVWEDRLNDYPIACEHDHGARELEAAYEAWEHMSLKERIHVCIRYGVSVFAARHDCIPDESTGEIFSYLADG